MTSAGNEVGGRSEIGSGVREKKMNIKWKDMRVREKRRKKVNEQWRVILASY